MYEHSYCCMRFNTLGTHTIILMVNLEICLEKREVDSGVSQSDKSISITINVNYLLLYLLLIGVINFL